jgi:hypothetical protein
VDIFIAAGARDNERAHEDRRNGKSHLPSVTRRRLKVQGTPVRFVNADSPLAIQPVRPDNTRTAQITKASGSSLGGFRFSGRNENFLLESGMKSHRNCLPLLSVCLLALMSTTVHAADGDASLTINGQPAKPGVYKPADIDALVISSGHVQITFGKDPSRATMPNPRGGGGGAGRDPAKDFSATSIIINGKEIGHNIHGVEPRDVNARRSFYLDARNGPLRTLHRRHRQPAAGTPFCHAQGRKRRSSLRHHQRQPDGRDAHHVQVRHEYSRPRLDQ